MTSDAALLSAARSDPTAFRELYDRYAERVHGYFARRTRDEDAAFDLTAETFAQAWLVRGRFRDEVDGSAAPWLFGIARNVLLMSLRRGQLERRAVQRLGVAERLDGPYEAAAIAPDPPRASGSTTSAMHSTPPPPPTSPALSASATGAPLPASWRRLRSHCPARRWRPAP